MSDYNVKVQPFKAWLEKRQKRAYRDAIDVLAKRLTADTRIPRKASKGTYLAHLRSKSYGFEDITLFEQAWQEMRSQDQEDAHVTQVAIIEHPTAALADVSALAEQFSKATRLTRYQEGLRDETIRRQKTDLLTFARFLVSINIQAGDFYNDLSAWQGIRAELLGIWQGFVPGTAM